MQYRFALLSLAGMEAPLNVPIDGSIYGEDCIFIANDWHAALVPVYLAAKFRPHGVFTKSRSILAIHNLRHQVLYQHAVCNRSEPHINIIIIMLSVVHCVL